MCTKDLHLVDVGWRDWTGTGIPERVISDAATVAFMGVACTLATPTEMFPPDVRDGDDLLPTVNK